MVVPVAASGPAGAGAAAGGRAAVQRGQRRVERRRGVHRRGLLPAWNQFGRVDLIEFVSATPISYIFTMKIQTHLSNYMSFVLNGTFLSYTI